VESYHMRRRVASHAVPGFPVDPSQYPACAALAIGAGHMYGREVVLWVPEFLAKILELRQIKICSLRMIGLEFRDRGKILLNIFNGKKRHR
ncbi:hypothetical protein, partial [Fodinibius sp.]|uniref:hypothetical protein n=1 Tax=Fodinibius sp. TaxID=1872440 RepID=UPI0035641D9B